MASPPASDRPVDLPRRDARRRLLGMLATGAVVGLRPVKASAQAWPAQPIKFIAPAAPGGSIDLVSRSLADRLRPRLGQSVVVENVSGAASVGVGRLSRAPADGYTIGVGNSASQTIMPLLQKLPYDPIAGFTPIALLTEFINVLVVPASSNIRDLAGLIALAKATPGGLNYGSAGVGSSNHLTSEMLAIAMGVRLNNVPYKGNQPALLDLVAGHLHWMFATTSEVQPFIDQGKLIPIAVSTKERDPFLPKVPALAETIPGFEVVGFMGLFGPPGLPAGIVSRLNAEFRACLTDPEITEKFTSLGLRAVPSSPEELAARVKKDLEHWRQVIAKAGIKVE
jgi:tripartite-type tricarboxylate transporter receptor subunit TctC